MSEKENEKKYKSGFVAILGRPNVGKSTLLNNFIGNKVAIVTDKPQTTRHRIVGVRHFDEGQIVFIDTPGIHDISKFELNKYLNEIAYNVIPDADIILFVIDAQKGLTLEDKKILEEIKKKKKENTKVYLIINKIDKVKKEDLLPLIDKISKEYPWIQEIIPTCATRGTNLDRILELIKRDLPEGVPYYPKDQFTDMPMDLLVAEIIREKIMMLTDEEVPHSTTVVVENIAPGDYDKNMLVIDATIYVEKKSHKPIIIGKGGQRLKKIGILARQELEKLLGKKVYLRLWVKVKEGWRDNRRLLKSFGYQID